MLLTTVASLGNYMAFIPALLLAMVLHRGTKRVSLKINKEPKMTTRI